MAQAISTSIKRRNLVAGLTLTAASVALVAAADTADAQTAQTQSPQPMVEKSLYERLGAGQEGQLGQPRLLTAT